LRGAGEVLRRCRTAEGRDQSRLRACRRRFPST
jgi:hypothetical protein